MLYALALLRCAPPTGWESAFMERAQQQLHAFDARGLATLLYALALLRRRPEEAWMAAYWRQLEAAASQVRGAGGQGSFWQCSMCMRGRGRAWGMCPPTPWHSGKTSACCARFVSMHQLSNQLRDARGCCMH